jgi:hypothetical protein
MHGAQFDQRHAAAGLGIDDLDGKSFFRLGGDDRGQH